MQLSYSVLCAALLIGCSTRTALPVASARAETPPTQPEQTLELRHMYLFAPGKPPVKLVERESNSTPLEKLSSEPRGAIGSW